NNQLPCLTLPTGLTNLTTLVINGNQLTDIILPPDMTQLSALFAADNPLTTFVLSEPLASTGMASVVDSFRNQGINVFTYPLAVELIRVRQPIGVFQFAINGPPGVYTILSSTNLITWSPVDVRTNTLGKIVFTAT